MATNRINFSQLEKLNELWLQIVPMFSQMYSDNNVQENILIDLQYKIEQTLNQFNPIVKDMQYRIAFGTNDVKNLIMKAEAQLGELDVCNSLLKTRLYKFHRCE